MTPPSRSTLSIFDIWITSPAAQSISTSISLHVHELTIPLTTSSPFPLLSLISLPLLYPFLVVMILLHLYMFFIPNLLIGLLKKQ